MKKTRPLIIIGIVLLVLSFALFILNIIMLANVVGKTPAEIHELADKGGMVGFFAGHIGLYGMLIAMPTGLILPIAVFCVIFGSIYGKHLDRKAEREKQSKENN